MKINKLTQFCGHKILSHGHSVIVELVQCFANGSFLQCLLPINVRIPGSFHDCLHGFLPFFTNKSWLEVEDGFTLEGSIAVFVQEFSASLFTPACNLPVVIGPHLEIKQLQGALSELLWKEECVYQSSGLGLCWHRTQLEIGRLQGAPDEQQ